MKRIAVAVIAGSMAVMPEIAWAHTGMGHVTSFVGGLLHPLTGLDHMLAMTLIGLWSAQLGGRALWAVPGAFVLSMLVGGWIGMGGTSGHAVELGIGLSVVLLGAAVALQLAAPVLLAAAAAAAFGFFHGHAHGSELPIAASALPYIVGFSLSTCALHGIGLVMGLRLRQPLLTRCAGAAAAIAGLFMIV